MVDVRRLWKIIVSYFLSVHLTGKVSLLFNWGAQMSFSRMLVHGSNSRILPLLQNFKRKDIAGFTRSSFIMGGNHILCPLPVRGGLFATIRGGGRNWWVRTSVFKVFLTRRPDGGECCYSKRGRS